MKHFTFVTNYSSWQSYLIHTTMAHLWRRSPRQGQLYGQATHPVTQAPCSEASHAWFNALLSAC